MKITVELNDKDIAAIIAEKYGVDIKDVEVCAEKKWIGYGPAEQEVAVASASVTIRNPKPIKEA